jgi:hypothetical protein
MGQQGFSIACFIIQHSLTFGQTSGYMRPHKEGQEVPRIPGIFFERVIPRNGSLAMG